MGLYFSCTIWKVNVECKWNCFQRLEEIFRRDKDLTKLQRILNSAARLVSRSKKQNHITPILAELHWLPIKARIQYKIILLTFNAVHGFAPHYISELVSPYKPTRSLRSSTQQLLQVPQQRTKNLVRKDFCLQCPNPLELAPACLRSQTNLELFKKLLKTHVYKKCFM